MALLVAAISAAAAAIVAVAVLSADGDSAGAPATTGLHAERRASARCWRRRGRAGSLVEMSFF